ncbi:MAG: hypothetical protein HC890_19865, partial [Chloroflexaceae bacterium]|nr:hypothetical protein [Chloroflexaceae bacterium]
MTHPDHRQRYPSAREALQAVGGLVQPTTIQPTVAVTPRPSRPVTRGRRSGNWLVQWAIALGLLGGVVAGYWGV